MTVLLGTSLALQGICVFVVGGAALSLGPKMM